MARTVEEAFMQLNQRQGLTDSQKETADKSIAHLQTFLSSQYRMHERPFVMGSYGRGTLCSMERDIDIIAPFALPTPGPVYQIYRQDSRELLYGLRDVLNTHYGNTEVRSRQVSVRLDFRNIVTEVVPAYPRPGGGYFIPDGNRGWVETNPAFHLSYMATADMSHGFCLKPLIRLIKYWNIANKHLLRSFHVELMVERMFRNNGVAVWPSAVTSVLSAMSSWIRCPLPDVWPDGCRVDDYLSFEKREQVAVLLESDAVKARQAEEYRLAGKTPEAFSCWSYIYVGNFPAYL